MFISFVVDRRLLETNYRVEWRNDVVWSRSRKQHDMSTLVSVRPTSTMNTNSDNNNNTSSSSTSVRSYGITQPISTKAPDPSDFVATKSLEDTLRSYDYFESSEELSHRVQVLVRMNALVREWIQTVSLTKNIPPEIAHSVGGRVHTFGSYRLGVHSKGKRRLTRSSSRSFVCLFQVVISILFWLLLDISIATISLLLSWSFFVDNLKWKISVPSRKPSFLWLNWSSTGSNWTCSSPGWPWPTCRTISIWKTTRSFTISIIDVRAVWTDAEWPMKSSISFPIEKHSSQRYVPSNCGRRRTVSTVMHLASSVEWPGRCWWHVSVNCIPMLLRRPSCTSFSSFSRIGNGQHLSFSSQCTMLILASRFGIQRPIHSIVIIWCPSSLLPILSKTRRTTLLNRRRNSSFKRSNAVWTSSMRSCRRRPNGNNCSPAFLSFNVINTTSSCSCRRPIRINFSNGVASSRRRYVSWLAI